MNEPSIIDRTVQQTNAWFGEVADRLESDDHRTAYRVLRAYLQALRDRLTVDEAAQLGAQLPLLIRGIYYEGWNPSKTPVKYHHIDEFLGRVKDEAELPGETSASYAVSVAAEVLRAHVSAGEIDDIRAQLPEELQPILG
ncbi:MAG TPA: DUF2267 domain-containing protein [Solirubrobacterales bacterium]|nr:DUF2267 domain-containing protein [Solirubrobacterales bacterium]